LQKCIDWGLECLMTATKHHVTIKGVKDGLVFLLSDTCEFEELLEELRYKLNKSHQKILSGPVIRVQVKLGSRTINEEQEQIIRGIISQQSNLILQSIHKAEPEASKAAAAAKHLKVMSGIVRSGQTLFHDGHLLYIGDINPGGGIACTGDIFVMGSLRGTAHAGMNGNTDAVIAASNLRPTQLRIADIISRPPDEWGMDKIYMEFAYLREGAMEIDKISQLHKIRPGITEFKGE
jgi:septum site-determining protein MinC